MITIGITGGVGCGKSEVLKYLKEKYNAHIVLADDVANRLKEPGMVCYQPVIDCLGKEVLKEDGTIDRQKMAQAIFLEEGKLEAINAIIHPEVKRYILKEIDQEKSKGKVDFFFVEAALLLEEKYDAFLDEMWYVFAKETVRRERLKVSRGYSEEKISSIMSRQLQEEDFRKGCSFVLDNSGDLENMRKQIDEKMGVYLCRKQI